MKTAALAIALLLSSAAVAQYTTPPDADVNVDETVQPDTDMDTDMNPDVDDPAMTPTTTQDPAVTTTTTQYPVVASNTMPASGPVVQPSNANPEHDARGIAVISDPAVVPAGYNGIAGTAMGGPLVDPTTGETIDAADDSYPPCTASVTDNCLQTYEVGSNPQ